MYKLFLKIESEKLNSLRTEETIAYYNLKEDSVKVKDELNKIDFKFIYKALIKSKDLENLPESIENLPMIQMVKKLPYEIKNYQGEQHRLVFLTETERLMFIDTLEISLAIKETLKENGLLKYPFHHKLGEILDFLSTENIQNFQFKVELINAL